MVRKVRIRCESKAVVDDIELPADATADLLRALIESATGFSNFDVKIGFPPRPFDITNESVTRIGNRQQLRIETGNQKIGYQMVSDSVSDRVSDIGYQIKALSWKFRLILACRLAMRGYALKISKSCKNG
eukprot:gene11796-3491_t